MEVTLLTSLEIKQAVIDGIREMLPQLQPQAQPATEIIDRATLCKRLAITEPTAIRWERKGKLPAFYIGSSVRYNWHDVLAALQTKGGSRV